MGFSTSFLSIGLPQGNHGCVYSKLTGNQPLRLPSYHPPTEVRSGSERKRKRIQTWLLGCGLVDIDGDQMEIQNGIQNGTSLGP